ncbi:MAG: cyclase [Leptolyngbya sp. SIO1D8]|nr:cyclase [Leptolyngbya sp. SIO1D8]
MTDASQLDISHKDGAAPLASDAELAIATEKLAGRSRRISASILVPCSIEQVWQVLTDYDNLADFIPNLTLSRRLEDSDSGTLLEQIGSQCFLNIQFCARVVLNMVEQFPHHLGFNMVEGDFKAFTGAWKLESADEANGITKLVYELTVCPPRAIPVMLIERHLCRDLTQNLQAIRHQAITLAAT